MTKTELIQKVAEKTGNNIKVVDDVIKTTLQEIKEEVKSGAVELVGFGTFKTVECAERKGVNPRTGEEITIKARKKPTFKPSNLFKEMVN